jgi:hypothetical protein
MLTGEKQQVLSTSVGPWFTSMKRSSRSLLYIRFFETRVPWRHPIEPDASSGVVDAILLNLCVNSGMEFYPSYLSTAELPFCPDIMNIDCFRLY